MSKPDGVDPVLIRLETIENFMRDSYAVVREFQRQYAAGTFDGEAAGTALTMLLGPLTERGNVNASAVQPELVSRLEVIFEEGETLPGGEQRKGCYRRTGMKVYSKVSHGYEPCFFPESGFIDCITRQPLSAGDILVNLAILGTDILSTDKQEALNALLDLYVAAVTICSRPYIAWVNSWCEDQVPKRDVENLVANTIKRLFPEEADHVLTLSQRMDRFYAK